MHCRGRHITRRDGARGCKHRTRAHVEWCLDETRRYSATAGALVAASHSTAAVTGFRVVVVCTVAVARTAVNISTGTYISSAATLGAVTTINTLHGTTAAAATAVVAGTVATSVDNATVGIVSSVHIAVVAIAKNQSTWTVTTPCIAHVTIVTTLTHSRRKGRGWSSLPSLSPGSTTSATLLNMIGFVWSTAGQRPATVHRHAETLHKHDRVVLAVTAQAGRRVALTPFPGQRSVR